MQAACLLTTTISQNPSNKINVRVSGSYACCCGIILPVTAIPFIILTISTRMVEKINVNEIKAVVETKHGIYQFLTVDCNVFLDKEDNVNMWFVKQIMNGQKSKFISMLTISL